MRTVYGIKDTTGELIAEHVRVIWPDGSKRMYWQIPGCDPRDGLMGLSTPDLPLYGSERLAGIEIGRELVVCEGEKATEALWSLGIDAVGTVTGAGSTPGEDALSVLLPFDVVGWADHDETGEKHMERVAARLIRLGGRARRLTWGTDKGDDAADFLERGGTRGTADLLIQAASPYRMETIQERTRRAVGYERDESADRVETARSHLLRVVEEKLGPPKRRMGRSMFWPCPFHSDVTPSFKVDLREPFFRCFGCDAKGDVFEFLQRIEGLAFKDALYELVPPRLLGAAIPW